VSAPTTEVTDWTVRARDLCDQLAAAGKLTSSAWRAALLAVPRHLFVPVYYVYRDGVMVRVDSRDEHDRAEWLAAVYSNTALVTKIAPGPTPTFLSSSSTPGLMVRMLEALTIDDGHRVLEIGTGTGYNAALLCHRLGEQRVYSIDIEPDLVPSAASRLAALGYRPTLAVGDGHDGMPGHHSFDRVIATCAVPAIPWAWVQQTTLGGQLLGDIKVGLSAGNLVLLTKLTPQLAQGRFDAGQASFMSLRHVAGASGHVPFTRTGTGAVPVVSSTRLNPRTAWTNPIVWFLTALRIGPHYRLGYSGGDPRHTPTEVVLATPDGSRAEVTIAPLPDGSHRVTETGPSRLWQRLEQAHQQWSSHGQPPWAHLGLSVTPERQTVFVDDPTTVLAVLSEDPT
jgi:methyltransferase of ATP-grasp peptide maturase system